MTNELVSSFTLDPRGPFSLDPLRTLACGFLRGTRTCAADGAVRIAFPREDTHEIIGAKISLANRAVRVEVVGARRIADVVAIKNQIARTLCLDHDGHEFHRVIERDPVLSMTRQDVPGFRPVVAYSPYVMAGWCVLSQRMSMAQAAKIQARMATEFGDVVIIDGEEVASFPRPQSILARSHFDGISAEKWTRLQAVARAATDGALDVAMLSRMSYEDAHAALSKIHGVGAWTADGILIRGTGATDLLPLSEPAFHVAIKEAYGLEDVPSDDEVTHLAESWRPFRTWVSVLLISRYGFRSKPATSRGHRPRRQSAPQGQALLPALAVHEAATGSRRSRALKRSA